MGRWLFKPNIEDAKPRCLDAALEIVFREDAKPRCLDAALEIVFREDAMH